MPTGRTAIIDSGFAETAMRSLWFRIEVRLRLAAAAGCLAAGLLLLAPLALAQNAPPPDAPPPKQGVFESIGRWFDQSVTNFRDHLRGAKRKMDDLGDDAAANSKDFNDKAAEAGKNAADATRRAVDAVAKLPTARMMQGHERCITAPNGAPDCLAAAEVLCRKHGFATGKSMDFTSAEECPARALLGQTPRGECTTVTFISRAICQ
ncbi:MAG: hypothetical protein EXQ83_11705 [Xanthobacteraceae bacterium]|nr:hypothetical protein [Xanthobacteraceae bacterium]